LEGYNNPVDRAIALLFDIYSFNDYPYVNGERQDFNPDAKIDFKKESDDDFIEGDLVQETAMDVLKNTRILSNGELESSFWTVMRNSIMDSIVGDSRRSCSFYSCVYERRTGLVNHEIFDIQPTMGRR
jgi:hypothetical protein